MQYPQLEPAQWFNPTALNEVIGNVPITFRWQDHLVPYVRRVLDGWFIEVAGIDTILKYKAADPLSIWQSLPAEGQEDPIKASREWAALAIPFVIHAAWSLYIRHGNVIITDSGPVTKIENGIEPISNSQRNDLSNYHKNIAEEYAYKLSKLRVTTSGQCSPAISGSRRPSIRSIGGKITSRFN